jgi:hypothetical protein
MKKNYCLLLFVLILSATANAQADWVTKNLDEKISVKLPTEPEKTGGIGMDVYSVKGTDGAGYSVSVMDFYVKAHIDSATLSSFKDNQQFADQVRVTMVSKIPNCTFGDVKIGKWKMYTAYTISGSENAGKGKVSIFIILIGSKMYGFLCMLPDNLQIKNDDVFFGSIDLVKK